MISWLLFLMSPSVLAAPPVISEYQAEIRIEKTWVRWEGSQAFIEREELCRRVLPLAVFDVRNRPDLRPQVKEAVLRCETEVRGAPVHVSVVGRGEWLRPRDFNGWVSGERDLLRTLFLLRVEPESPELSLQEITGQEILSENSAVESLIFRLAPADLIRITCAGSRCRNEGPEALFRAVVELKKNLPFN